MSKRLWISRAIFLFSRALFGLFALLTSGVYLLTYLPFAFFGFILGSMPHWLRLFLEYYTPIFAVVTVPLCISLIPYLRVQSLRRITIGFYLGIASLVVASRYCPLLAIRCNWLALVWSALSLTPLLYVALLDFAFEFTGERNSEPAAHNIPRFATAASTALFSTAVFLAITVWRFGMGALPERNTTRLLLIAVLFVAQLTISAMAVLAIAVIVTISRRAPIGAHSSFLLGNVACWLAGALILDHLIFPSLHFNTRWGIIYALAVSLAVTAFVSGCVIRISESKTSTGNRSQISSPAIAVLYLVMVAAFAYAMTRLGTMDWDFAMQKLSVIVVWAFSFAIFAAMQKRKSRSYRSILLAILSVGLGAFTLSATSGAGRIHLHSQADGDQFSQVFDQYSQLDVSFRVSNDLLAPLSGAVSSDAFYGLLTANTLINSAPVSEIRLSYDLTPHPAAPKPNIFIIVLDSLRQDYISAYNPKVDFTPEIGRFAAENIVMRNAFTRYAGTALAEPSIWSGSMLLHEEYPQQYSQINSLDKLLTTEGYERWVSLDPIVSMLLAHRDVTVLDPKVTYWADFDACEILKEVEQRITLRGATSRPLFVYTQPQNLHAVSLHEKKHKIEIRPHPGFDAQYASELQRVDRSFGEFITFLKSHNIYDNSLVVLTADHGDSFNDYGRFGHGNLFPEVLRIPLIVHLPDYYRRTLSWDEKEVAFSLDLTPSLYELLGHPVIRNPLFGRPLFTRSTEERKSYLRNYYPVVSSYLPIYGILENNGQGLYISDALNRSNFYLNLASDPLAKRNRITPEIQKQNEQRIRTFLEQLSKFNHYTPPAS